MTGLLATQSRLGGYVVQHRYRVDPALQDRLWPLLAEVRAHALALGVASFEIWRSESDPAQICEVIGYDSWSHCARLGAKDLPAEMAEVYRQLDALAQGSAEPAQTVRWEPVLPDATGTA